MLTLSSILWPPRCAVVGWLGAQVEEVRAALLCVQTLACNPSARLAFLGRGGLSLLLPAVRRPWAHCVPLQRAALAALEACCASPHWAAGSAPHTAPNLSGGPTGGDSVPAVMRSDREQASILACTSLLLGSDVDLAETVGPAGVAGREGEGEKGMRGRGSKGEAGEGRGPKDEGDASGAPGSPDGRGLVGGQSPMEEDEGPLKQQGAREGPGDQDDSEERRRSKRGLSLTGDGAGSTGRQKWRPGLTGYAVLARLLLRGGAQAGLSTSPAAEFDFSPPQSTSGGHSSTSLLGLLLRLQAHQICLRLKVRCGQAQGGKSRKPAPG